MAKRYIHTVDNPLITDAATFKTEADKNPKQYPVGAHYSLLNGVQLVVTDNTGGLITVGTITVV